MPSFVWDVARKRYRDSNGRFVAEKRVQRALDRSIKHSSNKAGNLAALMRNQDAGPEAVTRLLKGEVKNAYLRQYMLGRGGRKAMQPRDWGSLGGSLNRQYRYLNNFVSRAYGNTDMTIGQIASRINLYFRGSRSAYATGQQQAYGIPLLPAKPGDGQSECLTNCQCRWRIEEIFDDSNGFRELIRWDCYWLLSAVEHCPTCERRGVEWNPFPIRVGQTDLGTIDQDLYYTP